MICHLALRDCKSHPWGDPGHRRAVSCAWELVVCACPWVLAHQPNLWDLLFCDTAKLEVVRPRGLPPAPPSLPRTDSEQPRAGLIAYVLLVLHFLASLVIHMPGLMKDTCPSVNVLVWSLWLVMRWWVTSQKNKDKQTNEEEHCLFWHSFENVIFPEKLFPSLP